MNNKLFLERTELKIETSETTLNFIYPKDYNVTAESIINGVEIKWNYKSVNDEPNEFNLEIKGLSTTTISKIKLKDPVKLVAGYGTDLGDIASGIISRKEVEKGTLKLKCREVPANFKKLVSVAYKPGTTASYIIEDLAKNIGFAVKQLELKNDVVYSIGESILGSGLYEISQIVRDCDSKMTVKNDFIYIYHNEMSDKNKIKISYQSGLLEEPKQQNIEEISYKPKKEEKSKASASKKSDKKTSKKSKNANDNKKSSENKNSKTKKGKKTSAKSEKKEAKAKEKKEELKYDYEIKCLLIYSLKKGDLIELVSNDISTEARIAEISDISDFVMTLKLLVVNNEKNATTVKNKKQGKGKSKNKKKNSKKSKKATKGNKK